MKKTTKMMGGGLLALLIMVSATSMALAYHGDYTQKGPSYSEERHNIMEKAFESNDYNAWKEQMGDRGRATQVVTEENFSKFAEAHRLAEAGDIDGANAIRLELGLRNGNGMVGRGENGFRNGMGNINAGHGRNYVDSNGDGVCDNL